MVPLFKISVYEDDEDVEKSRRNQEYYVLIQPKLPNFDSFKEAVYDRFPVLKGRPLNMFYFGE